MCAYDCRLGIGGRVGLLPFNKLQRNFLLFYLLAFTNSAASLQVFLNLGNFKRGLQVAKVEKQCSPRFKIWQGRINYDGSLKAALAASAARANSELISECCCCSRFGARLSQAISLSVSTCLWGWAGSYKKRWLRLEPSMWDVLLEELDVVPLMAKEAAKRRYYFLFFS